MSLQKTWNENPVLRLTTAYVGILVILCLMFSSILYSVASAEIDRAISFKNLDSRPDWVLRNQDAFLSWQEERANVAHANLISSLMIFNTAILTMGGVASYFFARRTFRPIEDALEAQTRFSSDAAHELRTPLAVMQSEIDVVILNKNATKSEQLEVLKSAKEEVIRLSNLTDSLLAIASNAPVMRQPVMLSEVMSMILPTARNSAKSKNIKIFDKTNDHMILVDPHTMSEAVMVLIDNAIKYSKNGSKIEIKSKKSNRKTHLTIKDYGRGILEKDQKYIFDRLYRVEKSRTKKDTTGYGMGLPLAKKILERHNGEISVKSKLGRGSEFTLIF